MNVVGGTRFRSLFSTLCYYMFQFRDKRFFDRETNTSWPQDFQNFDLATVSNVKSTFYKFKHGLLSLSSINLKWPRDASGVCKENCDNE